MKKILLLACGLALLALPVLAQEEDQDAESDLKFKERLVERLRRAARLPGTAEEAREAGVSEEEVKKVLETGKTGKIPAGEMQEVLEEESKAVREHGTIDNFGSFVQEKLDQGLRGRELADAIHREHAARGKGKYEDKQHPGKGKGKAKGHAKQGGHPDADHGDDEHDHAEEIRERAREAGEEAREAAGEAAEESRETREKTGDAAKSRRGKKEKGDE